MKSQRGGKEKNMSKERSKFPSWRLKPGQGAGGSPNAGRQEER